MTEWTAEEQRRYCLGMAIEDGKLSAVRDSEGTIHLHIHLDVPVEPTAECPLQFSLFPDHLRVSLGTTEFSFPVESWQEVERKAEERLKASDDGKPF